MPVVHRPLCAAVHRRGHRSAGGSCRRRTWSSGFGSIGGYAASRTKWFDEFFIAAGANGIEQAVILAAGLDARAWRLPWVDGSVVYEIDQPKVLAFKAETLRAHDAQPAARYVAVPDRPAAGLAESVARGGIRPAASRRHGRPRGCCRICPPTAQDLLFERIHELSARGSRVAVESFGAGFFDREYLASRREQMRRCAKRQAKIADDEGPRRRGPLVHRGPHRRGRLADRTRLGGVGGRVDRTDDAIRPLRSRDRTTPSPLARCSSRGI